MSQGAALRSEAEALAGVLPPLVAQAEQLAAVVMLGAHGRRRSGMGDEFWQYRAAASGDAAQQIDWRRSARSDAQFVQEKEWQATQAVMIWVDQGRSMDFASSNNVPSKADRARLLVMAIAILLVRAGETVAVAERDGSLQRVGRGERQLMRMAQALCGDETSQGREYQMPTLRGILAHSRALFVSDFMGDLAAISAQVGRAADRGVAGAMIQILDPQEEAFPFDGRTVFESIAGSVRHETLRASGLRDRYLDRLAQRKEALADLARDAGWQYHCHRTNEPAQAELLWIYKALERNR